MYNINKILKGLLENSSVEVYGGVASTEIEDTKYYLYAVLQLTDTGYTTDFTFARKTSQEVSAETLEIIEMTPRNEAIISEHLLDQMPEDTKEECVCYEEDHGINNNEFINI